MCKKKTLKSLFPCIIKNFWLSILTVALITSVMPLALAEAKSPQIIPQSSKYVWYNGEQKIQIRMSSDEMAVFSKPGIGSGKDGLKNRLSSSGLGGEIISQNELVTFMKLSSNTNRSMSGSIIDQFQMSENDKSTSPVFYPYQINLSSAMALTGEIIIHFFPDWDAVRINAFLKEKNLTPIRSLKFSPNTFLI